MVKENKKVLVVDDEPNTLIMLTKRLSSGGYDVVTAKNGEEALSKAESAKPGLILLDIMMPTISGIEALHLLKEGEKTKDIPVIALTALSTREDELRALAAGAVSYITKPYDGEELLAAVKKYIRS